MKPKVALLILPLVAALHPVDGAISLDLVPEAIYTFTNTTGQQKGDHGAPPAPFPFPYGEDFETTEAGATPRFFADQKGTFEVVERPDGNGHCLAQIVPEEGLLWHGHKVNKPHTLFGDTKWTDYAIEADVHLTGGDAEIGGRYGERGKLGYRLILSHDGTWQLNWQHTTIVAGEIEHFDASEWQPLRLEFEGHRIRARHNGELLAEVTNHANDQGMAVLASSYDRNLFDNIRITRSEFESLPVSP